MARLDRFYPPNAADEISECVICQRRLHYELLNDDGVCEECTNEWCSEDVKAINEKRSA